MEQSHNVIAYEKDQKNSEDGRPGFTLVKHITCEEGSQRSSTAGGGSPFKPQLASLLNQHQIDGGTFKLCLQQASDIPH